MQQLNRSLAIYKEIKDRLIDVYSINEEDQVLVDTLDGCTNLTEQIAALARESLVAEAMADGMKTLIRTSQDRKARLEHKAEKLKALAKWAMGEAGIKRIPTDDMTLTLSDSSRAPLVITDANLIPDQLCKIERTPLKVEVRCWLNEGNECAGAHFGNPEPVLTIRRR